MRSVDLLKMSIEGAELDVVRGAVDALSAVRNVVISCHDFLTESDGDDARRTFEPVRAILVQAGFALRFRAEDPRPWVRYYIYGTRD